MMDKTAALLHRRIIGAFTYSCKGLRACYVHEEAFRVEVFLALFLIPLGFLLGDGAIEKIILVTSVILVLVVELLNSAVEAAIDRIGLEKAELSGRAKDQGSAAVLLSMVVMALAWGLILFEKL